MFKLINYWSLISLFFLIVFKIVKIVSCWSFMRLGLFICILLKIIVSYFVWEVMNELNSGLFLLGLFVLKWFE